MLWCGCPMLWPIAEDLELQEQRCPQPAPEVTLVVLGTLTALGWGHQPSPEPQGWGLSVGGYCCSHPAMRVWQPQRILRSPSWMSVLYLMPVLTNCSSV